MFITRHIRKLIRGLTVNQLIIWAFLPAFILSFIITGMVATKTAQDQILENAYVNVRDTLDQSANYLNSRLSDAFEQFVILQNSGDMNALINDLSLHLDINPESYCDIRSAMNTAYNSNENIIDSIYINLDNQFVLYTNDNTISNIGFDYKQWENQYPQPGYVWEGLHKDEVFTAVNSDNQVASLFDLLGQSQSPLQGIILFNFKKSFFQNILTNPRLSRNGYMMLLCGGTPMGFKQVSEKYQLRQADIEKLQSGQFADGKPKTLRSSAGQKLMVFSTQLKENNWVLITVLPVNELLSGVYKIRNITAILILVIIFLSLVLSWLISRIITKPIDKLARKVREVRDGNLEIQFDICGISQVEILNDGMGEMIGRVKNLIEQVQIEQEEKRNAEWAILQAQIKPHFLYNTLYSIKQLCDLNESHTAGNMIMALSNFYRIGLSAGKDIITIGEEFEHVKQYLFIQQMKYADDFDYYISMDEEVKEFMIPKLTLQPLVENSIYHGVKEKRGKCMIKVLAGKKGNQLILTIEDNGIGMEKEKLEEIRQIVYAANPDKKSGGYGIRNVYQRLKFQYREHVRLTIESQKNEGTVIRILLDRQLP